jgi:hypothetical protein
MVEVVVVAVMIRDNKEDTTITDNKVVDMEAGEEVGVIIVNVIMAVINLIQDGKIMEVVVEEDIRVEEEVIKVVEVDTREVVVDTRYILYLIDVISFVIETETVLSSNTFLLFNET